MTRFDRRTFFRLGGAAAGAALLPACVREAMDIPANSEHESIMDVEHVVILLQENRSFDHYFGTFAGVRGYGDRFVAPHPVTESILHQRDSSTTLYPYRMDSELGNAQRAGGTPHIWVDAVGAYDHGRYTSWASYKTKLSLGYMEEQELPFQFALAEAFTLCDAYHCGVHAGTNPNRLVAFTGTIDTAKEAGGPAIDNSHDLIGDPASGYTWTTYAERLEKAGVSWKVYQDADDNFSDNPLVGFRTFREAYANDRSSPLFTKGLATTLTNQSLDGLRADVVGATLPSVSWVVGPATYSEHPGPSSPVQGAWYVQQVLEALIANPEVWSKTVLIVTYDENDGFFDHVLPPCAPSLEPDGTVRGGATMSTEGESYPLDSSLYPGHPYGPGPRVPMWLVSPFSRGGWVNSETFDHTSILRFLEERFGVEEPNISAYRRAVCGNLRSAFNFSSPNTETLPTLPSWSKGDADQLSSDQAAAPAIPVPIGDASTRPVQATGTRPSRALPYELDVRASVKSDVVRLTFVNEGSVGAVFHVYDKHDLTALPRRYAVGKGKSLVDDLPPTGPAGAYDLFVLGPNGFHRALQGAAAGDSIDRGLEIAVVYDGANEAMTVRCTNGLTTAQSFTIVDRGYGVADDVTLDAGAKKTVSASFDLSATGRWYDFEVTVPGIPTFLRRVAGRVENGEPSVTDPAMGMV